MKIGFSAEKYIEEQSKYIRERINSGNSERLLRGHAIPPDSQPRRVEVSLNRKSVV